ncbi:hypothetical protein GGR51DRAFT_563166 [Nemania sp. FL0031]|nr:hypothetical protein GGR51DRAFT_563166 [Nemania sp. FL0031]
MADLFCCVRNRKVLYRNDKSHSIEGSTSEEDIIIDFLKNEGADYQRELWRQILDEERESFEARQKRTSRPSNPSQDASGPGDETSPEAWLQQLTVQYNERGWQPKMATVRDVFETIQPFTSAITSLTQSNGAAQIVWGSLMLVFQAVLRFANLWDDLNSLLESLTKALPRIHLYTELYHTPRLHKSLRLVYRRFIDICLTTQDFLEETCMSTVLRIQWASFAQTFKRKTKELLDANMEFEKEVELASHQEQRDRHIMILSAIGSNTEHPLAEATLTTNIDLHRNDKFCGRQDVLLQLQSYLEPGVTPSGESSSSASCLIHAIGGMGKTETALEYTYRFRSTYSHIFWLRAQSADSLRTSYLDVVMRLNLLQNRSGPELSTTEKVRVGLEWFQSTGRFSHALPPVLLYADAIDHRWLLVFDNAEDIATIRPFWPASTQGSIIVTSQNPQIQHLTQHNIQLKPLTLSEGASLIQTYLNRGRSEEDAAKELSSTLGGHPLAIIHFVGYISRSQCPIDQISRDLNQRLKSSRIWNMVDAYGSSDARAYKHSLRTVWDLALDRLTDDSRLLLECMAFLDPDHTQVELFVGPTSGDTEDATSASGWQYWDRARFDSAVANLSERHLIERYLYNNGDSLRIHRALQRSILNDLDRDLARRDLRFETIVSILRRALPTVNIIGRSDASQFPTFARYLPQVLSVHAVLVDSHPPIKGSLEFVEVVADIGFYCRTRDETVALPLLYTAERICKDAEASKVSEDETRNPLRLEADILSLISVIVKPRGKEGRDKAMVYIDRIIAIHKEELKDIPREKWTELQGTNFFRALMDKALTLCYADQIDEAAPMYKEGMEYYKSVGNEVRLNHLRVQQLWVLSSRQKKEETQKEAAESLDFMIRTLGEENPLTQQSRSRAAGALFTIGDVEKALKMHEQVFGWRLGKYGNRHDETFGSQYCLAVCYQHVGELEKAVCALKEILSNSTVTEEWRVQDVTRVKFRLYLVLKAQGKQDEAGEILKEMNAYLVQRRGDLPAGTKEWTDKDDMGLLDGDIVTLDHGRTCGIWSNGQFW